MFSPTAARHLIFEGLNIIFEGSNSGAFLFHDAQKIVPPKINILRQLEPAINLQSRRNDK